MKVPRLTSLLVATALQVLPLTRGSQVAISAAGPMLAIVFRLAAVSAAMLGAVDAVSGATVLPVEVTTPLNETVFAEDELDLALTTAPYLSPYWTAEGLPEGLTLEGAGGNGFWSVIGKPRAPGIYLVSLTAYNPQFNAPVNATVILSVMARNGPPIIQVDPVDAEGTPGQTVTFGVVAASPAPLHYQWRRNGSALSGQESALLTITNLSLADAGSYAVDVQNEFGVSTSRAALLTVDSPNGLAIESIVHSNDGTVLRWVGNPGMHYEVVASESASGPWIKVGTTAAPMDPSQLATVALPNDSAKPHQFYRLQLVSEP